MCKTLPRQAPTAALAKVRVLLHILGVFAFFLSTGFAALFGNMKAKPYVSNC